VQEPAAGASAPAPASPGPKASDEGADWTALIEAAALTGSVRMLAINCAFVRRDGHTVYLTLDPRSESLLTRQRKEALTEALTGHFGSELVLDITVGEAAAETPAQAEDRLAGEKLAAARENLESDPNVQALKDMFGAELNTESIELIEPSQEKQQRSKA
jgi:DNA polymerase-3 subunit gamma/tau